MIWTPTSTELNAIRQYAADAARIPKPQALLMIGERYNVDTEDVSINTLVISEDPDFGDTDLVQTLSLEVLSRGVELRDGRAQIDCYVYKPGMELEINVQAHVGQDYSGRPRLYKMTGTMVPLRIINQRVADRMKAYKVGIDG